MVHAVKKVFTLTTAVAVVAEAAAEPAVLRSVQAAAAEPAAAVEPVAI